jgi:ribonuclease Z
MKVSRLGTLATVLALHLIPAMALAQTQVVVLGTGTPVLDADRAGAGIAVVHNGRAYLFDVGGGVVQRSIEASRRHDIPGLLPTNIDRVFFTHLHSDHVLDFAELAATLWWRKEAQIQVWGPTGVSAMAEGMVAMLEPDITIRNGGTQPVTNPEAYKVVPTEIEAGVVLEEDGLTVEAFDVAHGGVRRAFGYRITTPDKTIVISGDTAYSETLVEMARGADILLHEVISETGLRELEPFWQDYHSSAHTTSSELARLANQVQPDLLVLYHILYYGAPIESALEEVRAGYDGAVVLAEDLDIY